MMTLDLYCERWQVVTVPFLVRVGTDGRYGMNKTAVLRLVRDDTPASDIGTVTDRPRQPPRRRRNDEVRAREHLTPDEVETLMKAARKRGRYGQRDAAMVLVAYRHGLRVSELVALRWRDIDLDHARMMVRRLKGSEAGAHPLAGDEL